MKLFRLLFLLLFLLPGLSTMANESSDVDSFKASTDEILYLASEDGSDDVDSDPYPDPDPEPETEEPSPDSDSDSDSDSDNHG